MKREPSSTHAPRPVEPADSADELADFLADAYLVTDADGMIRRANRAACALFNKPHWYLVGKPLAVFVDHGERNAFRVTLAQLHRKFDRLDDWRLRLLPSGREPVDVLVTAAAIADDTGTVHALRWLIREPPSPAPAPDEAAPPGDAGTLRRRPTLLAGDRVTHRMELLVEACALIARLDANRMLAGLADLLVPALGDWCIVDLLSGGERCRTAVAHAWSADAAVARALRAESGCEHDADRELVRGWRAGRTQLVKRATEASLDLLAGTPAELELLRRLGVRSWMSIPMVTRGRTLGALTFLVTASGRRYAEPDAALARELASRAAVSLENAALYDQAREASEAKSTFLAMMSHELRTPLAAILGYTELLSDGVVGPVTDTQREHLDRLRASCHHLLALVDGVLSLARAEAGKEMTNLDSVDARDIVDQTLAIVEHEAALRRLALRRALPDEPVPIVTDVTKLRQVLLNVLSNAVKFTHRGEVGVAMRAEGDRVVFEVWDTGIGIAPENLDRIFERFWQVDQRRARLYSGAGLGLAIVQRFVQLLAGSVTVSSEPGAGSRFTLTFPRDPLGSDAHRVLAAGESPTEEQLVETGAPTNGAIRAPGAPATVVNGRSPQPRRGRRKA